MILVTGGTGFIGSHLVERLMAQGRAVRCLVRPTSMGKVSWSIDVAKAIELVPGDLDTGAGLPEALRGIRTVIHLAGVTKARVPADYDRGNALATAQIVRAAGEVGRFVHVSSLAAAGPSPADGALTEEDEPRPVSLYGRSKLAGERIVRQSPIAGRSVVVRPPVVYGPRDTDVFQMIRAVARGWMLQIGRVRRYFSLVYVADLVDGLIAAAELENAGGRVFYMAHATAASWDEFAGTAARLMRRSFRTLAIPESAAYVLGSGAEWWSRLSRTPGILSRDKVTEACCPGWVCDPGRACREIGFCAPTNLEEGLRRTLDWYKEAGWLKF